MASREEFINWYIEQFVDVWGCKIDHEDGSTAPFSSLAAHEANRSLEAYETCL